jgi:hypothetical protein
MTRAEFFKSLAVAPTLKLLPAGGPDDIIVLECGRNLTPGKIDRLRGQFDALYQGASHPKIAVLHSGVKLSAVHGKGKRFT